MLVLSVIAREFRDAARKKRAHGLRLSFGVAMTAWFGFMVLRNVWSGAEALGQAVYQAVALPLNVGMFLLAPALAAPSIAVERREDTLGLLFLTKLRPFHIVLAKFTARVVELFSFLLFALPFLVMPILLGGVDKDQVIGDALGLLIMLLFGTAVGLCCSAFFRGTTMAFLAALAALFALEFWWLPFQGQSMGVTSLSDVADLFIHYQPGFGLFNAASWLLGDSYNPQTMTEVAIVDTVVAVTAMLAILGLAAWQVRRLARIGATTEHPWWRQQLASANRIGNLVAALVCLFLLLVVPTFPNDVPMYLSPGDELLGFVAQLILLVLVVRTVAGEKDARTLESLACTPVSNTTIVNRKILGALDLCWGWYLFLSTPRLLWLFQPVGNPGFEPTSVYDLAVIGCVLTLGFEIFAICSLGCLCSSVAKSSKAALALAVPLGMVVGVIGHLLTAGFTGVLQLTFEQWPGLAYAGFSLVTCFFMASVAYLVLLRNFRKYAARE